MERRTDSLAEKIDTRTDLIIEELESVKADLNKQRTDIDDAKTRCEIADKVEREQNRPGCMLDYSPLT